MLGIPLITRTIEICQRSQVFASILVTTDSAAIAEIAINAGAQVHERPATLADDYTGLLPVMADATTGIDPELPACCVYATAVTLQPSDLVASWDKFVAMQNQNGSDGPNTFLTGVVEYPHPIQRALTLDDSGALTLLHPEFAQTRTQDLAKRWHDAGVFIWGSCGAWARSEPVLSRAHGFELPYSQVIDLDTEDDWLRAESLLKARGSG